MNKNYNPNSLRVAQAVKYVAMTILTKDSPSRARVKITHKNAAVYIIIIIDKGNFSSTKPFDLNTFWGDLINAMKLSRS